MKSIIDALLHLDVTLGVIISQYGTLSYLILFLVIFLETGLVLTPFLPGDSLLFAAGAFAAKGALNPFLLFILLSVAAIIGDAVNYWIGHRVGARIFEKDRPFISEEYLKRTQLFYEKHGKKTIIFARFVPIIRTFAPFIAGVGKMPYKDFVLYNIIGGLAWVALFVYGGFWFGNIPVVQNNFETVIIAMILVSFVPTVIEFWKHKNKKQVP